LGFRRHFCTQEHYWDSRLVLVLKAQHPYDPMVNLLGISSLTVAAINSTTTWKDLAARNCLLGDNTQVKVADFGLTHKIPDGKKYWRLTQKMKLPVKWMSTEAMQRHRFSEKSDVWAFGVTCWEISAYGTPSHHAFLHPTMHSAISPCILTSHHAFLHPTMHSYISPLLYMTALCDTRMMLTSIVWPPSFTSFILYMPRACY
jgi:serine/threonine protein kinase